MSQKRLHTTPACELPFYEGMLGESLTFIPHRGGDGAHENTLRALDEAKKIGVRAVEMDVVSTLDDIAVFYHGNMTTRRAIQKTLFSDLNTPSTRRLIGFSQDKQDEIPPVEEALRIFPDLRFFLDIKMGAACIPTAEAIIQRGAQNRVSIDGERWERAARIAEMVPGVSTTIGPLGLIALWATYGKLRGVDWLLQNRYLARAASLSLPQHKVNKRMVDIAHELGKPVFLHVVNEQSEVDKAIQLSVDGVMTDRLDLIKANTQKTKDKKKKRRKDDEPELAVA